VRNGVDSVITLHDSLAAGKHTLQFLLDEFILVRVGRWFLHCSSGTTSDPRAHGFFCRFEILGIHEDIKLLEIDFDLRRTLGRSRFGFGRHHRQQLTFPADFRRL
jgi:hypothetical protein